MKNIFNFLFASMLILSMQGCSKDLVITDEPNAPEENESVQLRLTGNVAYMTPETRLGASGFDDSDVFGIYTSSGKMGPDKINVKNAKYVFNNGTIEAADEDNVIYWEENKDLDIYAYYPYDTSNNAGEETAHLFTIKINQSTPKDYYGSDFLRAESEDIAKTSSPVGMTFYHLMSKVSVTINHDSSITDEVFNSYTKVLTIEGVADSGCINLKTGVTAEPSSNNSKTITALANGNTFSAIIFPQNRNDVKFRLKLGDKYYSSMLDIAYESGKEYRYIFTVTKNEGALSLKSTRIESWGEGGTIEKNMTAETK